MRAARVPVSADLLASLLHVPAGARIIGASFDFCRMAVDLIIDDPVLPEADKPHDATPSITTEYHRWDWGELR